MKLYLVRHGQTEGNVSGIAGLDPPLTDLGIRQARLAGRRLAAEGITHLYGSPLLRALQTAELFRETVPLNPAISPLLCEMWGTRWRARTVQELQPLFPWVRFPDSMNHGRWWPTEEESRERIFERGREGLDFILQRHPNPRDRVGLISHYEMGNAMLHSLLKIAPDSDLFFHQRNCAFTCLECSPESTRTLYYLNDAGHLPEELWTY